MLFLNATFLDSVKIIDHFLNKKISRLARELCDMMVPVGMSVAREDNKIN